MNFDPLSRGFSDDPYAVYKALRLMDQPFYFAEQDMWLLSRYDDISAITLNSNAVRSLSGFVSDDVLAAKQQRSNWHDMPYHERFVQFSLLDSDGDIHRRLRSLVFKSFTNKGIAHLESIVDEYVQRLIMTFEENQQIDFVNDFAVHIPGFVIGTFLGVPEQDCPQLRIWSEKVVKFFDVDRSDALKSDAETATREFYEYLIALKQERTRRPRDDLMSNMIADQADGTFSDDEFISICMLILMAGHGSTIDVLGSGMHLLLKHPEVAQQLRDDMSLLPGAIQEIFRLESPLPFFHRHMIADVTLRDHHFPQGTTFGLLYGAGNRDSSQFDKPDMFNIKRRPNRHLAFGRGVHLCLGNHLAKMNMNVIFETLLLRFSSFVQVDEAVVYKPGLSVRGPITLNIQCV